MARRRLVVWPPLNVCTIIAKNYVAPARVLARSLAEAHPDSRLQVLVIDDFDGYLEPEREPFDVLMPADVGCTPFMQMAMRYSVLELSTAVKPWLMRHLLRETGGPVLYLDPDIRVYGSLQHLADQAAEHGVALTPHNSKPMPADGLRPSQVDVMIAGIYNLGFLGLAVRSEVEELIDWWEDRLLRDCRVDPRWGYFVDQRWFDLAPGFLEEFAIVREPQFNIAYWNMHERRLERRDDGVYTVDGRPLGFFHFSGFDPEHPLVLSRHQNRVDVAGHPVLETLLAGYAAETLAQGHVQARGWSYGYAALADGSQLDDRLRRLYDQFTLDDAQAPDSLFTLAGLRRFERWLAGPAPGAPAGLDRALATVLAERIELQPIFIQDDVIDVPGLRQWAEVYGIREEPVLARLAAARTTMEPPEFPGDGPDGSPSASSLLPRPPPAGQERSGGELIAEGLHRDPWGVNVVGYFRSEAGTGEAARSVVSALDHEGVPVLPIHGQTVPISRQDHPYETVAPEAAAFPVNLICMNADMLPEFARQVSQAFFSGRYSAGLWFWEVERFPERWRDSFSLLEEVWAPTAHVAAALAPLATVPVHRIRLPITPSVPAARSRNELGLEAEPFTFLFTFDYLSVAERKNPLALIEAFTRSFGAGDDARLVIKCINAARDADYHARVCSAVAAHPSIQVIDRYLSSDDNASLTAACDCYVSLHRAEGFGLGMGEAMWHGRPVIATGYSGNLDFMTVENSHLVDYELTAIGPGCDPYPPEGVWAQPDVGHAASLMRQVFDDQDAARALGARAAAAIRDTHSVAACGEILTRQLEAIRATGRPRPAGAVPGALTPALSSLTGNVRRGPAQAGQIGRTRAFVRRAALRAMRSYTGYQQGVNAMMVEALEELRRAARDADRTRSAELARLLAKLRRTDQVRELRDRLEEQRRRVEELERRLDSDV